MHSKCTLKILDRKRALQGSKSQLWNSRFLVLVFCSLWISESFANNNTIDFLPHSKTAKIAHYFVEGATDVGSNLGTFLTSMDHGADFFKSLKMASLSCWGTISRQKSAAVWYWKSPSSLWMLHPSTKKAVVCFFGVNLSIDTNFWSWQLISRAIYVTQFWHLAEATPGHAAKNGSCGLGCCHNDSMYVFQECVGISQKIR